MVWNRPWRIPHGTECVVAIERIPNSKPPMKRLLVYNARSARGLIALKRHDEKLDTLGQDTQTP